MAINIFSGSSAKGSQSSSAPKVSTSAQRAAASTSAVGMPASASDSGNTAVGSGGIMGKVGSLIKNVAGMASLIPGPVGTIGSIVNALTSTNDPEWWQQVPGDGLTTNNPLQTIKKGNYTLTAQSKPLCDVRPAMLDFTSYETVTYGTVAVRRVLHADDRMVTQYLLPQVRRVVNAVTLQDAKNYGTAIEVNATIYALRQQLLKDDFLLKHGQTFLPTLSDGSFPILTTTNAATLQSLITRLEEYLNASVRLPHTLCEYLTWRYGRLFRTNASAKAGIVVYDVIDMTAAALSIDTLATQLMAVTSSDVGTQKASTDLYNAYLDHDQAALLDDASQMQYDSKEFVLRTNLDLISSYGSLYSGITDSTIVMDSNLDNPTVFMASTLSCYVDDGLGGQSSLFPVQDARVYFYDTVIDNAAYAGHTLRIYGAATAASYSGMNSAILGTSIGDTSHWHKATITPYVANNSMVGGPLVALAAVTMCKAVDFYNVGIFAMAGTVQAVTTEADVSALIDLTALSIDCGSVNDIIIRNEQVFAFANLVNSDAKSKATYKQVEKRVANDVANFVEQTPIATLAPGATSK